MFLPFVFGHYLENDCIQSFPDLYTHNFFFSCALCGAGRVNILIQLVAYLHDMHVYLYIFALCIYLIVCFYFQLGGKEWSQIIEVCNLNLHKTIWYFPSREIYCNLLWRELISMVHLMLLWIQFICILPNMGIGWTSIHLRLRTHFCLT